MEGWLRRGRQEGPSRPAGGAFWGGVALGRPVGTGSGFRLVEARAVLRQGREGRGPLRALRQPWRVSLTGGKARRFDREVRQHVSLTLGQQASALRQQLGAVRVIVAPGVARLVDGIGESISEVKLRVALTGARNVQPATVRPYRHGS